MKRSALALAIWTAAIAFMLGVTVIIYPEMATEMDKMTDMFANMGSFSDAFGLDQLNFGEFIGYFAVECGNTLGIGGSIFAAILGVSALSSEERNRTAEFLLTHPLKRSSIVSAKLLSVVSQILVLNLVTLLTCITMALIIGEGGSVDTMSLILLPYLILQLEIACLTFGISAFMRKGAMPVGIGIAFGLYFVNILSNITKELEFLRYLTPFSYTDGGYIVKNNALEYPLILIGIAVAIVGVASAFIKYTKKDIA
jgi:ABC-2 type transport system permease protein